MRISLSIGSRWPVFPGMLLIFYRFSGEEATSGDMPKQEKSA
jgi:hypothetical protein